MLISAVNIAEGRDQRFLKHLKALAGAHILDIHSDRDHNRSVFTLLILEDLKPLRSLAEAVFALKDIRVHEGLHPRLGLLDVVPFSPLPSTRDLSGALELREEFAKEVAARFGVPVFLYGPEKSLPLIRKEAFRSIKPDFGPAKPHLRLGSCCVGARTALVAYNLVVKAPLDQAKNLARSLRSPEVRVLVFPVAAGTQISFNLVAPDRVGPKEVYRAVSEAFEVKACELVGLVPEMCLRGLSENEAKLLGLLEDRVLERRVEEALKRLRALPADVPS